MTGLAKGLVVAFGVMLAAPAMANEGACAKMGKVLEIAADQLEKWSDSARKNNMAVLRVSVQASPAAAFASDLGWPAAGALGALRDLPGSDLTGKQLFFALAENASEVAIQMPELCPGTKVPDFAPYTQ